MTKYTDVLPVAEKEMKLKEKVTFLKQPFAYPHPVLKVETKETHMSWIFMAGDFVYKLKKPVVYRFLDFRTLDARLQDCEEEIRLNKQLAGFIYMGIIPLVLNEADKLQLEGKGRVVEWLVKMKRIPDENFLDYGLKHHTTDEAKVKAAARLLTEFYKNAPAVTTEPALYRKKLQDEVISTRTELLMPIYHFPVEFIEHINNNLTHFLTSQAALFDTRMANGRIIEAHGDLRPEHIVLYPRPAIIDALEFNRDLRIMDIAEELSFLDMECEMMGSPVTGQLFLDYYQYFSNDSIPVSLIHFYKTKKAFLRAYLVARHVTEPAYKDEPRWLNKAYGYLQLANKYI